MTQDTPRRNDGLIDVSRLTLRELDEVDESSLALTLRRLLGSSEQAGDEIAGWQARL